jgi:hypothetical protein
MPDMAVVSHPKSVLHQNLIKQIKKQIIYFFWDTKPQSARSAPKIRFSFRFSTYLYHNRILAGGIVRPFQVALPDSESHKERPAATTAVRTTAG